MNPNKTINVGVILSAIKQHNYRVKLTHNRYFGDRLLKNADIGILNKACKIMVREGMSLPPLFINNRGGVTEVICTKGDKTYEAFSDCSIKDPFVYKTGALIALKRLMDQLPEPELQSLGNTLVA